MSLHPPPKCLDLIALSENNSSKANPRLDDLEAMSMKAQFDKLDESASLDDDSNSSDRTFEQVDLQLVWVFRCVFRCSLLISFSGAVSISTHHRTISQVFTRSSCPCVQPRLVVQALKVLIKSS